MNKSLNGKKKREVEPKKSWIKEIRKKGLKPFVLIGQAQPSFTSPRLTRPNCSPTQLSPLPRAMRVTPNPILINLLPNLHAMHVSSPPPFISLCSSPG